MAKRDTYKFTIPMTPQGKGRGRAVRAGKGSRVITPEKTRTYEATVVDLARAAIGELLLEGPIAVKIWCKFPRSKEQSKIYKKTNEPKCYPGTFWAERIRIDVDNLAKAILDSLNGAIWVDDKQVTSLTVLKTITPLIETPEGWRQEAPRVEVTIVTLADKDNSYGGGVWPYGDYIQ